MNEEDQIIAQINQAIEALTDTDRLTVAKAEGEIRRIISFYKPWGQLALAKVGAELSTETTR